MKRIIFFIFVGLLSCGSQSKIGEQMSYTAASVGERLSFEESWKKFREGTPPTKPTKHVNEIISAPKTLGFSRTMFKEADFSNLSIPSTYFDRSLIEKTSFYNTDLSYSALTWNDFIEVNFSHANLRYSDLRASIFQDVKFDNSDLRGADLRRSSFENCSFLNTNMENVILTNDYRKVLQLSEKQLQSIAWTNSDGPEPTGG